MDKQQKRIVDAHVRKYLTAKVKEKFPEDFHLIERVLDDYIDRYSLKEILLLLRIEIEKLKRPPVI